MRLLFALVSLLFFSLDSRADFIRETTFEDRAICEKENKGVWREFGDVCVDACEPKFDQFKICDRAIRYSCDCGVGRCWKSKKCMLISQYKKTYEENLKKENEKIAEARKARESEAKENASIITEKLIQETQGRAMSIDIEGAANNYADVYKEFIDDVKNNETVQNASQSINKGKEQAKKKIEELPPIPTAPPIVIDNSQAQPTPTFIQQEELKKKQSGLQNQNEPPIEGLPLIPLPPSQSK
jgi:hypothetical protein